LRYASPSSCWRFPVYEYYDRSEGAGRWAWIALVAVSAGIASNLLDDIIVSYTTDFIQLFESPSANFADLFSYAGIVVLAIGLGRRRRRKKPVPVGFAYQVPEGRAETLRPLRHPVGFAQLPHRDLSVAHWVSPVARRASCKTDCRTTPNFQSSIRSL
jgi:hypothetical protein